MADDEARINFEEERLQHRRIGEKYPQIFQELFLR